MDEFGPLNLQPHPGKHRDLDRAPRPRRRATYTFAATNYRVGNKHRRRSVQVAIVGDTVEISAGGEILRVHEIKHDRTREHGAFANAGGRPSRSNAA